MKQIPEFASDLEESDFWDSVDIGEYLDPDDPGGVIRYIGPPRCTMGLRLDVEVVELLKGYAERHRTSYSSLANQWLSERLRRELAEELAEESADEDAARRHATAG